MSWNPPPYVPPSTSADGTREITFAVARRGVTEAMFDGTVRSPRWRMVPHDIKPLGAAFRMMVSDRSFHVSEMALSTLAMAMEYGRPIIGLPVVPLRDFHYRSIVVRTGSGITEPHHLEGRRIGLLSYSQTTGVWVRGILQDKFALDPASVTWVALEPAHVREYADPAHVEHANEGETLASLLARGDIDAAIMLNPDLDPALATPLFADAAERAAADFAVDGIYPVNHVIALDSALAAQEPDLVEEIYGAFVKSKQVYLRRLHRAGPQTPADHYALELEAAVGGDFSPYGLSANRDSCEQLFSYSSSQGVLSSAHSASTVFHPVSEF